MYKDVICFLQDGLELLQNLSSNKRRQILKKARNYSLSNNQDPSMLKFQEKNGVWSPCILEGEVTRFFSAAHENHGHFKADLCLNYLIGRAYWPTRVKDVYAWYRSCHSCQAKMKKPIKAQIRSIQVSELMKMLVMDLVGPISPAYSITMVMYVLLVVGYFTRFVWAKSYLKRTADEVVDIYENRILPYLDIAKQYTPITVSIL